MKRKIFTLLFFSCAWGFLFTACGNENQANRLQINQKYTLQSWPDSAYIADLDSILHAEPLKANADSEKTELTIYSGTIPTITLPGQKSAKSQAAVKSHSKKRTAPAGSTEKPAVHNAENFADAFMKALSELQSDPNNAAKYKTVSVKDGEDLFALLSRAYGKNAAKLPRFYTLSALQSVDPGVKLEHLTAGEAVRIPKL